jgi:Tol biopolymer transport system component
VVANGDGSERSILPPLTAWDREPAWAPDGRRLVFTGGPAGRPDLWIVEADGTGLRRLTRKGGHSASWSEKNLIAYARGRRIRTVRPGGTGDEVLTRGANPDWFPTGAGIIFDRDGNVYTYKLRQPDPPRARLVVRRAWSPVFSPNGKKIAFLRPPGDAPSSLYTATIEGKRVKRVYRPSGPDFAFNFAAEPTWGSGGRLVCAPKPVLPAQQRC